MHYDDEMEALHLDSRSGIKIYTDTIYIYIYLYIYIDIDIIYLFIYFFFPLWER